MPASRDRIESVKIDLPEEYIPLVIDALEHYYAYTRAKQHEDVRYQDAANWFKRKRPGVEPETAAKRTGAGRRSR